MRKSARSILAIALGAALVTGVTACDNLPDIDPSNLPSFSRQPAPTESAEPEPTEPAPTESAAPEPVPTNTVTQDPEPVPTKTVTEQPAPEPEPTQTSQPEVTPTSEAAPEDDESTTVWWPWVLLALVVLVIVILLARRAWVRSAWDKRLAKAKSELSWFEDSLIGQILSKPTAAEAASLWQAARPRVLALDSELHELAEVGPSEDRTAAAQRGSAVLKELTNAIDAETSTQADTDADALRARRAKVGAARAQARNWIAPTKK